jgi:general secretion pathway protein E
MELNKEKSMRLGELFVIKGYCLQKDIDKGLDVQQSVGGKLGNILLNLGVIAEAQLLVCLADQLSLIVLPSVEDIELLPIDFPKHLLKENKVLPYREEGDVLYVLTDNPLNLPLFADLGHAVGKKVKPVLTSEENIKQLLQQFDDEKVEQEAEAAVYLDEHIDKLKELASEAPVIKLVNKVFSKALEQNATDIHFESLHNVMKVRYRIDGILHQVDQVPQSLKLAVITRLKIISGMNIAENRLPQDGRLSLRIAGREVDIRASSVPTQFGESFVLRLLGKEKIDYSLESLGFYPDHIEQIKAVTRKTKGIFLTTGPTGSGKTTTLYSMLSRLNSDEIKIITVEDPVEYEFKGVSQISVRPEIGFTFANALRSILRQDPDVIMVGEMRDFETAEIAIQSALTGYLVLSTLHTNSALASVTRLLDMGVEYFLLKASIAGIMAQRLARRLCPHCSIEAPIPEDIKRRFPLAELTAAHPFVKVAPRQAVGCPQCDHTGYLGRLVIAEMLPVNERLLSVLDKEELPKDIGAFGLRSILEDGLLKALEGRTSIDEVLRVAQ